METVDERISKKMDRRKLLKTAGIGGAIGVFSVLGNKLGVEAKEEKEEKSTKYPIGYGSFASSSVYTIFQDSTKTYAKNGRTGAIDFSGLKSGDFTADIYTPIQNALMTTEGGSSTYARGGIVTIFPGNYTCTTPWVLPTDTNHAYQVILKGSGRSNTIIYMNLGNVDSAIKNGHINAGWITGAYSPKFCINDLSMLITGTFSGSAGNSSTNSIVNLCYYDVYFEDMQMNITATLKNASVDGICVGGFAGPSEPVTWKHAEIGFSLAGGSYPFFAGLWEWYEGFTWRGGILAVDGKNPSGYNYCCGTAAQIYGNGPTVIEAIDNYGTGTVGAYIYVAGANIVLNNLEWPGSADVVTSHISGGSGATNLTIIHTQQGSAINQGMHLKGNMGGSTVALKTIGFSFGKQLNPFWEPGVGQGTQSRIGVGQPITGGTTVPIKNKDYMANTDFLINCSGGTGVSISILDDWGNTIASGLTSLTRERFSQGMHINFGDFSVAPTVSVYQVGG